jgi:hypothetical protein
MLMEEHYFAQKEGLFCSEESSRLLSGERADSPLLPAQGCLAESVLIALFCSEESSRVLSEERADSPILLRGKLKGA